MDTHRASTGRPGEQITSVAGRPGEQITGHSRGVRGTLVKHVFQIQLANTLNLLTG